MKRALMVVVLLALAGAALAQVGTKAARQGSWLVSGQGGFDLFLDGGEETDTQRDGFHLLLAPRVLYFVMNGLGVGIEGNYDLVSQEYYKQGNLAVGPRVAYYVTMPRMRYPQACCLTPCVGPDGWWLPYAGLSLLYLAGRSESGSYVSTGSGYRGRAGIGVSPLIGPRGTAFAELGYQLDHFEWEMPETDGPNDVSRIYLEFGFGGFLFR
ncbi:hypothetical protein JXB37_04880 [candidate division WOR-3 bacterium]|nr:hypothetical protein [candidate division WOR-3 bacterium]